MTTALVWEQDVSKTGIATGNQAGSLLHGSQGGILGSAEEHITNCIVSRDAISIATTANLVVPEMVGHAMALKVGVGSAVKGNTQSVSQTTAKLPIMKMETQGG